MEYKNERKRSCVMKILFFAVIMIILISCNLFIKNNSVRLAENREVRIIENKSFLSDFEVYDNEVHVYCVVSLENNSSEAKKIKLVGNFKNEVDNGLLKSDNLEAYFIEDGSNTIYIAGNSNITNLKIEFVGEYAGNPTMSSRRLPDIDVVEE